RFGVAARDGCISALADMPIHTGHIGSASIKKILSVVQVEDRKVTGRLAVVAGRQVHHHVARVSKVARRKFFVFAKLSSAHGAIVTSRSLASTFCPGATRSLTMRPEMGA